MRQDPVRHRRDPVEVPELLPARRRVSDAGPLPAPRKNTIGADQVACVDYVQSKRDGSGDTYLYLLLTRDARVSVG